MDNENTNKTIIKAFTILEELSNKRDGYSLAEISKNIDMPKSTVFRYLSTFIAAGYVEQTNDSFYRLSLKIVELAKMSLRNLDLKIEARSLLLDLASQLKCTIHLATREELEIIYLDKINYDGTFQMYSQIGLRNPVWCTSLGKAILMLLPEKQCYELLTSRSLYAKTGHTITDPDIIMQELKISKERGWTIDNEENEYGIRCIGAPILDYKGQPIASISASGTKELLSPDKDKKFGESIKSTAKNISMRLGNFEI